jgi:hypothetical protein
MHTAQTLFATVSLLLLGACKPSDLSRTEASSVIQTSLDTAMVKTVMGQDGGWHDGVEEGLWTSEGEMTQKGHQDFEMMSKSSLTLKVPLRRTITKITGIASAVSSAAIEATSLKDIEFDWAYADVHGVVRRLIAEGGSGVATLRRFDDGWRVASIAFSEHTTPFTLTSADIALRDSSRAATRRLIAEQMQAADIEKKREAQARVTAQEQEMAALSTKRLGTFPTLDSETGVANEQPLRLTDVGYWDTKGRMLFDEMGPYGSPDNCDTPLGSWRGYCVDTNHSVAMFADERTRDAFMVALKQAILEWRAKKSKD